MKTIEEQIQEVNRWASKNYGDNWESNLAVKATVQNRIKELLNIKGDL